ncbi:8-oxo-dGTP diphosphatase MutT [Parashewanella curva]|uniref:8-oxo-dGTP diphosphatase n=1 Tax=Parashewanella curva TaxID=2338552 RepID=A0A3L8PT90_9GAMM|nr:8-oxo-dGTP diphosphatase MutT [Parashewanella curva]RLV58621.1 8-oxo-dGTP diphosphatase MutT [Parashewanella curva]
MKRIHVAVGVIINSQNQILIAKRHEHLHQGGKWEFPGGKVEEDETTSEALIRELKEEVNLNTSETTPFMELSFDYPDKQVFLDIHKVTQFTGAVQGVEGQEVKWVCREDLTDYQFPEANQPILEKIIQQN